MQEFIHNTARVIGGLFDEFNEVQKLYAERSFDFDQRFADFLNKLSDYFNARGQNAKESEVLRITNMLHTVKRGFDPSKMEKIGLGRRELVWGFSYNAMDSIHALLQEIHKKENTKLEEGKEILTNLVMSLIQQGVLKDEQLKALDSIPKIEALWNSFRSQNGSFSVVHKKLLTFLIHEDILLLLEKIVSDINAQ